MRCFEFQFWNFLSGIQWVSCFFRILEEEEKLRKILSADDNEDDDSYWNIVGISMSWIESKMGTKEEFLEEN